MILVIDNYDSFTWNLVHYLRELGAKTDVVRNDEINVEMAMGSGALGFILSPGPGRPEDAGISLDLIAAASSEGRRPVLGVCLGHQVVAQHFGGTIVTAPKVMHGKTSSLTHRGNGVFSGLPSPFSATRYHSLAVEAASLPDCLEINAEAEDGTIQGLRHRALPVHGVQFHPESVASRHGHRLLANFLRMAGCPPNPERLQLAETRMEASLRH